MHIKHPEQCWYTAGILFMLVPYSVAFIFGDESWCPEARLTQLTITMSAWQWPRGGMEHASILLVRYQREGPYSLYKWCWMTFLSPCESSVRIDLKPSLGSFSFYPLTMFPLLPLPPIRKDSIKVALLWVSAPGEEFLGQRFLSYCAELTTLFFKGTCPWLWGKEW